MTNLEPQPADDNVAPHEWPSPAIAEHKASIVVGCLTCHKPLVVTGATEIHDSEWLIYVRADAVGWMAPSLKGGGFGVGHLVFDDQTRLVHDECAAKELATRARWAEWAGHGRPTPDGRTDDDDEC